MHELVPLRLETFSYSIGSNTFVIEGSLIPQSELGQTRQVSSELQGTLPYRFLDLTIREVLYRMSPSRE